MISYKRDVLERQSLSQVRWSEAFRNLGYITFSRLEDDFIQRNLQMRTIEVIKINKRATRCKSNDKSQFTYRSTCTKVLQNDIMKKKTDRMEKE